MKRFLPFLVFPVVALITALVAPALVLGAGYLLADLFGVYHLNFWTGLLTYVSLASVKTAFWIWPYRLIRSLNPMRAVPYVWAWETLYLIMQFSGSDSVEYPYDRTAWEVVLPRLILITFVPAATFHWYFRRLKHVRAVLASTPKCDP